MIWLGQSLGSICAAAFCKHVGLQAVGPLIVRARKSMKKENMKPPDNVVTVRAQGVPGQKTENRKQKTGSGRT
nr:hypothetical protein [Rhodoferax sp.]